MVFYTMFASRGMVSHLFVRGHLVGKRASRKVFSKEHFNCLGDMKLYFMMDSKPSHRNSCCGVFSLLNLAKLGAHKCFVGRYKFCTLYASLTTPDDSILLR